MEVSGERIGVVAIWPSGRQNFPHQIQQRVRDLIRRAAPHAWRAREYRLREEEATRDRLTGLANRRALEGAMHRVGLLRGAYVLATWTASRSSMTRWGTPPAMPPAARRRAAQAPARGRDLAARIGGEEFVLWLPDVSYNEALAVAERVRDALETSEWRLEGHAVAPHGIVRGGPLAGDEPARGQPLCPGGRVALRRQAAGTEPGHGVADGDRSTTDLSRATADWPIMDRIVSQRGVAYF